MVSRSGTRGAKDGRPWSVLVLMMGLGLLVGVVEAAGALQAEGEGLAAPVPVGSESAGGGLIPAIPAQQARQLPDEVRAWLEADQTQRWAAMIRQGKTLFDEGSCTRCHGEGGSGGQWGPDLTDAEWVQSDGSLEGVREAIFWGVRRRDFADASRRFEMNPAGGMQLEWDEVRALAAYVWSLQNGDSLSRRDAGRP